jgi:hypothetical protein
VCDDDDDGGVTWQCEKIHYHSIEAAQQRVWGAGGKSQGAATARRRPKGQSLGEHKCISTFVAAFVLPWLLN